MRTYSSDMRENQKTGNSAPLKVLIDFFAYSAPLKNSKQIHDRVHRDFSIRAYIEDLVQFQVCVS